MKSIFICLLLCLSTANVFAQNSDADSLQSDFSNITYKEALYPGGKDKFFETINMYYEYPASLRDRHIEGTILVKGTIDTDGVFTASEFKFEDIDTKMTRDDASLFVKEMRRVLKRLKKWQPASYNGKAVSSKFQFKYKLGFIMMER